MKSNYALNIETIVTLDITGRGYMNHIVSTALGHTTVLWMDGMFSYFVINHNDNVA